MLWLAGIPCRKAHWRRFRVAEPPTWGARLKCSGPVKSACVHCALRASEWVVPGRPVAELRVLGAPA